MGLGTLFRELSHDLRSSWRFRVAALLWIPFFVVICVGISKFDYKMYSSYTVPGWRVAIIPNEQLQFPEITFQHAEARQPYFDKINCPFVPVTCGGSSTTRDCFKTPAGLAATRTNREVSCFLELIQDNTTTNTVFSLSFPAGWNSPDEQIYVTPNDHAVVEFTKTVFKPSDGPPINQWHATVTYKSSVSDNNGTVTLRMSSFDTITYTQYIWFDQWQFQGAFGGFVFFYWMWFMMLYSFLKNFLPNDSKLFQEQPPAGARGYTAGPEDTAELT